MLRPPLFRDLTLEAAHAEARSAGKVVLLDVFGEACPPCRQMDRTTWRAPEVERWVAERAVALQLDQRDPAVEPLGVMAVPTMIVFRDGAELDRAVGGRGAPELLAWLDGVLAGKTELDALRAAAGEKDLKGRFHLASALVLRGKFEEAQREFLWLWQRAVEVEPEWVSVKHSYLLRELQMLVAQHAPSREAFAKLRDDAAPRVAGDGVALTDFLALNSVLGDEERTLAWWDGVKDAPPEGVERAAHLLELLEEKERWADIGKLVRDPAGELRQEGEMVREVAEQAPPAQMPKEMAEQLRAYMQQRLRVRAEVLCRSARAAGRTADALAVAAEARRLDGSREMEEALSRAMA